MCCDRDCSHGLFHSMVHAGTVQYSTRTVLPAGRGGEGKAGGEKKKEGGRRLVRLFTFSQYR